jgi:NDP-sugar pyrophosphorylase family protein
MYRERLTITLDTDLLAAVDSTIDRSSIRNRSHAIEHLLREGLALHQLTQAFLFIGEDWNGSTLPKIITLCDKLGITSYYLVPTPITISLTDQLTTSITQLSQIHPKVQTVSGDFGTGGALVLQKDKLHNPFLLIDLIGELLTPTELTSAYGFHRRHNGVLTQILTSIDAQEFLATGFSIANPELIAEIPAGSVSLTETVFPALLKEGKVKGYVSA